MLARDDLIQHLLTMRNGTTKTTPQPEYYRAAAAFYSDLFPDWKLGQGLREAMQTQQESNK